MHVYVLSNILILIFSGLQARSQFVYHCTICTPRRLAIIIVSPISQSGCSLRMLNPQAFSSTVWNVLSILQEQFGSMAGANV